MKKYIFLFFIVNIFLLSACQNISVETLPMASASPSYFYTDTPIPTPTFTFTPTNILLPSSVVKITPYVLTLTPSLTPFPTLTPSPDFSFKPTAAITPTPFDFKAQFPHSCKDKNYQALVSPDGKWVAENCFGEKRMQISNQDGTVYNIDGYDFYTPPVEYPDLWVEVSPQHWTKDSQYIFFTVNPERGDGCVEWVSNYTSALGRLRVSDGQSSLILSGGFVAYSFSPTDRRLFEAQGFRQPVEVRVHDLVSGEIESFTPGNNPKFDQAGGAIWSPDGLHFVFIAGYTADNCIPTRSLILTGVNPHWQRTILEPAQGFIQDVHWTEGDVIKFTVQDYFSDPFVTTIYEYNFHAEKLNILYTSAP